MRLAQYFGTDPMFWMHLQLAWDMHAAAKTSAPRPPLNRRVTASPPAPAARRGRPFRDLQILTLRNALRARARSVAGVTHLVTRDPMNDRCEALVLGIGNVLWADEGFGVRAVEALHAKYAFPRR